MKIVVIGASGRIGTRIVTEAFERGHEVTAVSRHVENIPTGDLISIVQADASDEKELSKILEGKDALISSISPRGNNDADSYLETIKVILNAAKKAAVPYTLIVGGATNLIGPDGIRILDKVKDVVPSPLRMEITTVAEARKLVEKSDINWTFFCPGGLIDPGERTGKFVVGGDQATFNFGDGTKISMEDYAVAAIDELENPQYEKKIFHAYNS
jgi:uncharacterized protein